VAVHWPASPLNPDFCSSRWRCARRRPPSAPVRWWSARCKRSASSRRPSGAFARGGCL